VNLKARESIDAPIDREVELYGASFTRSQVVLGNEIEFYFDYKYSKHSFLNKCVPKYNLGTMKMTRAFKPVDTRSR